MCQCPTFRRTSARRRADSGPKPGARPDRRGSESVEIAGRGPRRIRRSVFRGGVGQAHETRGRAGARPTLPRPRGTLRSGGGPARRCARPHRSRRRGRTRIGGKGPRGLISSCRSPKARGQRAAAHAGHPAAHLARGRLERFRVHLAHATATAALAEHARHGLLQHAAFAHLAHLLHHVGHLALHLEQLVQLGDFQAGAPAMRFLRLA